MAVPEYLKIGAFEFAYKDCNDYQRSIYEMLSIYLQKLSEAATDVKEVTEEQKEYLRVAGVVRFLKCRLEEFGELKEVPRDLYDWESQLQGLLTEDRF